MKTINTIMALVLLGLLGSCGGPANPSNIETAEDHTSMTSDDAGIRLDYGTEMETAFKILVPEHINIVDGNDKKISSPEVALNSTFSIVYDGVKNYSLKNGKAFPSLSIRVLDSNQIAVLNATDLLASYTDGLSLADASVLRATVTVGDPMKAGQYTCIVQVSDKNNTDAVILSTWVFDVK